MKATIYLDILKRRLLRNYRELSPKSADVDDSNCLIYQQDGASSHTAIDVQRYFNERSFQILPWPAKSPDLI